LRDVSLHAIQRWESALISRYEVSGASARILLAFETSKGPSI
jgi:hypothetical protein